MFSKTKKRVLHIVYVSGEIYFMACRSHHKNLERSANRRDIDSGSSGVRNVVVKNNLRNSQSDSTRLIRACG